MEASEKPTQQSLDALTTGTVRVLEDRIVVEDLTIADEDAARVVRQRAKAGEEPARTVRRTIEIGARVLDREDAKVEVDFVRREYERVMEEHRREAERLNRETTERVEQEIRRAFGDGAAKGALAQALEAHAGELSEAIEVTFGEDSESGVPQKVQGLIEKRNREFLERLSADDELNPLRPLVSQFSNWVRERRQEQDERDESLEEKLDDLLRKAAELAGIQQGAVAAAEAEEAGTRKGRSFEERVHGAIERIASARGDAAAHTGAEEAEGGGRKGDTLVELGAADGPAAGRIVFEAKDKRLSRNDAWRELNEAMAARAASFGVLVVAGDDRIPARTEQLTEYEGNKMIVAVDREEPGGLALEVAYRLAAARMCMAHETGLDVDAIAVRDAAAEAVATLRQAQSIRSTLTGIKTSSDKARAGLDALIEAVRAKLEQIEALVNDAD